jgi:phosphatidylserine/phosphatidylglycerophosphate/cardiolipin synthase-like enzyme
MARSVIVLPDDSAKPILDAIEAARRSLRIKMFVFSDPSLLDAVVAAHGRGIKIQVMLNPARRSGEEENEAAREQLLAAGVLVEDSNPAFDLTHEKSMVVDDAIAFVKSLNWAAENLTETRDYAVVTDDQGEVAEIIECFEADWGRKAFDPGEGAKLIWCNTNGRERVARFIDEARHTIFVQNERYQDPVIIERLVRAKERGVKVHVMARKPHTLKKDKLLEGVSGLRIMRDVGIKVHTLRHLKLHAKMLLADGKATIIGSINLAPGSFDARRELGIEVRDRHVVRRVEEVAHRDWKHSHTLDLTDEGLLSDLEKRHNAAAGAETLILDAGEADTPKRKSKRTDRTGA